MFCVLFKIDDLGSCRGNTVQALTQWQHPVASSEALDALHQAMCIELHIYITMAIKTIDKLPAVFDIFDFVVAHNCN